MLQVTFLNIRMAVIDHFVFYIMFPLLVLR